MSLAIDRNPDLIGSLCREVVKAERRQQADYSMRDLLGGYCETVVLGDGLVRQGIDASRDAL